MTMPSPKPQEIIDAIIDHLYDDKQSLSRCALVSRSFVPEARLHLFQGLAVDGSRRPFDDFLKFLQCNPHICYLIRYLNLMARPKLSFSFAVTSTPGASLALSTFTQILALLPRLQDISLAGIILESLPPTITDIPSFRIPHGTLVFLHVKKPQDLLALLQIISCKTLSLHTVLQFYNRDAPELTVPPNLEDVQDVPEPAILPGDMALEHLALTLDGSSAWIGSILKSTPSTHTLTDLDVTWTCTDHAAAFGELLRHIGPRLESLKLHIAKMTFAGISEAEAVQDMQLYSCTSLKTLAIELDLNPSTFDLMTSIIHGTSKTLSHFRLEWDPSVYTRALLESVSLETSQETYKPLETALLRCRKLKEVDIKWHMFIGDIGDVVMKDRFGRWLPAVNKKTQLQFEVDYRPRPRSRSRHEASSPL